MEGGLFKARPPSRAPGATPRLSGLVRLDGLLAYRRDQVLHVARLARLTLSEEEIEPMARELSAVLDQEVIAMKTGASWVRGTFCSSHRDPKWVAWRF